MSPADESDRERSTRNLGELLQELRVAQAGVQFLFGFLLSVAFTDRYAHASSLLRGVHLIAVLLAAAASVLLTAPAAWHRILFRLRRRQEIIRTANWMAVAGLLCLAAAMTATVTLLMGVVIGGWIAIVVDVCMGIAFAVLWFLLPIRIRRMARQADDA